MGFLRKLFGRDNDDPANEASDYDESLAENEDDDDWGEALSYEDAKDIWLSSGMDEDYDFRPTDNEFDDTAFRKTYDKSAAELISEYRSEVSPVVKRVPSNIEDYNEHEVYRFVCNHCDGYGIMGYELNIEGRVLALLDDCDYCRREGFIVKDVDDAEDAFRNGDDLAEF